MLKEVITIYKLLIGKIAEQKKLQGLTNADIGKLTGYSKKTIDAFMCGARETHKLAIAISNALHIEM